MIFSSLETLSKNSFPPPCNYIHRDFHRAKEFFLHYPVQSTECVAYVPVSGYRPTDMILMCLFAVFPN